MCKTPLAGWQTIVAGLAIAASGLAAAAQEAPPPPQEPAPAGQEARPTFSVAIDLVTTDIIPRDADGRFVANLTKDDFEVLEDGVPQEIVSFTLVHGGRTFSSLRPPPPPTEEGIILPTTRPTADVAGRVFLVIADDLHLEAQDSHHVRAFLKKMLNQLVHEGDLCALITTGPSAVQVDYTYDVRRLEEAVSRVTGYGLTFADLTQGAEGPSGPADVRNRASAAFATIYNAVNELDRIHDKRKAVILVSTGYDFDPFHDARRGTDKVFGGRYGTPMRDIINDENPFYRSATVFADSDLAGQLVELTLAASRANASIFTVDPRGLVGTTDAGQQIDMGEWTTHLQKMQGTLRLLADRTGGIALVNQNDFGPLLKQVDAVTSDYYVLGFYSSNPDPTRRVRQLDVNVKQPGVTVSSRLSYSLRPIQPAKVPETRAR